MTSALPSDTVKNPKLNVNSTSSVSFARSYSMRDPQSSSNPFKSVNAIKTYFKSTNALPKDQQIKTLTVDKIETPKPKEPEKAIEDEFKDFHLKLPVLEVLSHASTYNVILDKYVESLELGSKPLDTLVDLRSCVNLIPLSLFKKLKIGLFEETDSVLGLADGTKSYPLGIVRDVEVRKAHLLKDKQIPNVGIFDKGPLEGKYRLLHVVDVFIPNKRSKAGKRFAFVRFINVLNLDRLIENLKTIWIGRFHLSANLARIKVDQKSEHQHGESNDKEVSSDPFNIYDLLDKRTKEVRTTDTSTSIPYPPGFTPANDIPACNNQDIPEAESVRPPSRSARSNSRVLEEAENSVDRVSSESFSNGVKIKEGGSILEILEEMITVGQTMGFSMEGLGSKAKKDWIKELISKHKVSFLSIQETKMESVSAMEVKFLWGNYFFDHIISEASGNSGGILCAWDTNFFKKDHHTISDNFIALYGTWIPNNQKLLIISVYAPQSVSSKRMLWSYLESLITSWNGESLIMGDFNEVRCIEERWGSVFNSHGANAFNSFISNSGLNDIQLEGFSFTWAHPSATKMSKLDRFLMSNGLLSAFPLISAICLDRHLSDHRPILLKEVFSDFGPTPFRFYHSWLELPGFDDLVSKSWNSFTLDDSNGMIRFKKKLQMLKKEIRAWTLDFKRHQVGLSKDLKSKLCDIDKVLDQGGVTDDILLSRLEVLKQLHDVQSSNNRDIMQKAKIRWAIEGDENSKYFHAIINKKRANLSVKGIMVDGDWIVEPDLVKQEFRRHFTDRFQDPGSRRGSLNFPFPNRLNNDQILELESPISNEDIRTAVWGCGVDKSPGPDGFTFEFFRKYWTVVGPDFCIAVKWFFDHGDFAIGCNSSFVALIPKVLDPKVVSDYRPISLIGSLYKVVTKILASRLSLVISDLISDVQTAFLPNRQILDGPFIINEILARCKLKKQQAMIFKVDFAKAYDSVRWDYLDDVLISFGFGPKWRSWIRGSLSSGKASILVNGSPTTEFHLYRGLKQGDPLAPFLFLLIMESLHLSFSRAVEAGIFKGYKIDPSTTLSHLFYADDAVFIGEWSHSNLKGIMNILRCFSLLSGMSINIQKSHLLGVGIPDNCVAEAAKSIGCLIMKAPFKYLGILVGDNMSSKKAWDETINKMKKRLSRWKLNTLSVGGRLTLLKSVLGSTPIYNMSIFKVPKSVLNYMESLRRNFFNGFQEGDRKIAWVKWSKVLASKKFGGLGVSSFFALNRALLFKWVWRYLSHDNSLWSRIISALHGLNGHVLSAAFNSTWSSIITEVNSLKVKGVDLISHCGAFMSIEDLSSVLANYGTAQVGECSGVASRGGNSGEFGMCFRCNKLGHWARHCAGEGSFGKVYKGWIEKKFGSKFIGSGSIIAVKKLNSESMKGVEEWQVDQVYKDECIVAVYDLLAQFCERIFFRLSHIRRNKNRHKDVMEAISSLIFASARCRDLPELLDIRRLFSGLYGERLETEAVNLLPGNHVNIQIIEKLSIDKVSDEVKCKLLKEISKKVVQATPLVDEYTSKLINKSNMNQAVLANTTKQIAHIDLTVNPHDLDNDSESTSDSSTKDIYEDIQEFKSPLNKGSDQRGFLFISSPHQITDNIDIEKNMPLSGHEKTMERGTSMPCKRSTTPLHEKSLNKSYSLPPSSPHVHPKLPDYDVIQATFVALKKQNVLNRKQLPTLDRVSNDVC
ncbi:RNA-directed DNA polymerase, eukaryota [Tanacetum coccineum]